MINIDHIISRIKKKEDLPIIEKAYTYTNEKLIGLNYINGEPLINYILEIANTLLDFNADNLTIISCILYGAINSGVSKEEIEKEFDSTIANIALGTSRINKLELTENLEIYLRETLFETPENVRSLFINLAERFYNMQTMQKTTIEYQKKVAKETLDILVPAASRLGLNYIRSRLEDLCLFYLEPETYNFILENLNGTPDILSLYLNNMKKNISDLLSENNIEYIIKGRVKNIYSIYNKLASGKKLEDIYDILAIRILVESVSDCNKVLELIHSQYNYMPTRFKDYINNPKENMYQSLHTTIKGSNNRFYEIQIRTYNMNKNAEKGDAAHRLYKERKLKKSVF